MTECECGHAGLEHAAHEPRVCSKIDCHCFLYKAYNPFQPFLNKIDEASLQFETWYDRMFWLCDNMPFLFGMNNTQIVFFYWQYVYPKWNPEEEFLDKDLRKAIEGGAKPEGITRGFRLVKEKHPDKLKAFQNLRIWQGFMEKGYHDAALEMKA